MSIQKKKVILIQNEKDNHVHVLGNLDFSNSKVLGYLTSTSVLIVGLYYLLPLSTKVRNFLLGGISTWVINCTAQNLKAN